MWKPILGYEGFYEVSEKGEVRSVDRMVKGSKSGKMVLKKGELKNQREKSVGYKIVDLYMDNKRSTKHVHRLVAESFLENTENKDTVNHKDGNKRNNHVNNLEWCTIKENNQHSFDIGLRSKESIQKATNAMHESRKKKVIDTDSGIIYESITKASANTGLSVNVISNKAKNKIRFELI